MNVCMLMVALGLACCGPSHAFLLPGGGFEAASRPPQHAGLCRSTAGVCPTLALRAGDGWPQPSIVSRPGPVYIFRRSTALAAKLNRQHDFGIDQNKVDALFDRIDTLVLDVVKDVDEKFIRGSGAGGQKINKTSSNVQLIHLPTGTQVNCQRERMREKNRFLALRDLVEKLEALKGGGPTKADKVAEKKKKQKARRRRKTTKKLDGTDDEMSDDTADDSHDDDQDEDQIVQGTGGGGSDDEGELPEDHPDYVPPWFR